MTNGIVDIRTDPTIPFATNTRTGRPDSIATFKGGKRVFIECKSGDKGWTTSKQGSKEGKKVFGGWTPKQREYALWAEKSLDTETYICLFVGTEHPHLTTEKFKPRKCFLIPFQNALNAVQFTEGHGIYTIPYDLSFTRKKFLKATMASCVDFFSPFELIWTLDSPSYWRIPEAHPFFKYFDPETVYQGSLGKDH